jgi:hypothetical protein
MEKKIGFFKKVKLGIWFLFNKDKYLEYIDSLSTKLVIYNQWVYVPETGWEIYILTSNGELLQHSSIMEGKEEEAKQLYSQDVKSFYNGAFDCDYKIVDVYPEDVRTKEFLDAVAIVKNNFKEDEPHFYIFDMIVALDKMEDQMKKEGEVFSPSIQEVYDFSHIEKD